MSTSVVLLAYKEAENLKILLPQIHKVMEKLKDDYEVIVIDSAKPLDNTKEVCEKIILCIIHRKSRDMQERSVPVSSM